VGDGALLKPSATWVSHIGRALPHWATITTPKLKSVAILERERERERDKGSCIPSSN